MICIKTDKNKLSDQGIYPESDGVELGWLRWQSITIGKTCSTHLITDTYTRWPKKSRGNP